LTADLQLDLQPVGIVTRCGEGHCNVDRKTGVPAFLAAFVAAEVSVELARKSTQSTACRCLRKGHRHVIGTLMEPVGAYVWKRVIR
jgi:hypothetical protein